ANTIPLWKQQIAQALTIQRSRQAAASVKQATDLTNELLTATSETLGIANREVREQLERGIVDIETLKKANDALIGTINDALNIADEGRKKRAEAETQLKVMEDELKRTLAAAKARTGGAG
ncbi:MAG: toxic anion resistance protein, partial [Alphaproteobacteria bacterium]|nr:toxic anion resistance protein [Alphaproteobacteria bacterium]MDX5369872.1 toxic anion resistance protein [Alphaproteobacteria bacterium]MDX5464488.1 toxic anion resistance protein [Alphaproteobacteria bacterium]